MMYGYYGGDWVGHSIFGGIFMIIFWVIIICVAVRLLRGSGFRRWHMDGMDGNRAIDILKERYAKGEIGKEEFEAKKKDLMS